MRSSLAREAVGGKMNAKRMLMRALLLAACVCVSVCGCSSTRIIKVETEIAFKGSDIHQSPGREIIGYTTSDAVYHEFPGFVQLTGDDSIRFFKQVHVNNRTPKYEQQFSLARTDVATILAREADVLATMGVICVAVATVALVVALLDEEEEPPPPPPSSTTTSCPLLYSWDGRTFELDGEPFGGATVQALERTDYSRLERMVAVNGRYRMLLANEMEESQHTNSIELLVVDHAPSVMVAMDFDGAVHAFRSKERLISARDERGTDLLPWLSETDQSSWNPDLPLSAKNLPAADTRNHITMTFRRPGSGGRAYLLAGASTGLWGANMLRDFLELRGNSAPGFYAALNGSQLARDMLRAWEEREELFHLDIEVFDGREWVKQGFIPGGGPLVGEVRAIPMDLSGIAGDTVRIRVHPPIGFWTFNSFHLASGEETARSMRIAPVSAKDAAGRDVLFALALDDDSYLDFPTNDDRAVVEFKAPPRIPGLDRTLFARARGWYEIRLRNQGPPDAKELALLTLQPGYAVQRSLREYASFRDSQAARHGSHDERQKALPGRQ